MGKGQSVKERGHAGRATEGVEGLPTSLIAASGLNILLFAVIVSIPPLPISQPASLLRLVPGSPLYPALSSPSALVSMSRTELPTSSKPPQSKHAFSRIATNSIFGPCPKEMRAVKVKAGLRAIAVPSRADYDMQDQKRRMPLHGARRKFLFGEAHSKDGAWYRRSAARISVMLVLGLPKN